MKKYYRAFVLFLLVSMVGCTTNANNVYTDTYLGVIPVKGTDCSGEKSSWEICYRAAAKECPLGYKIILKADTLHFSSPMQNAANDAVYEMKNGKGSTQFIRRLKFDCKKQG
jgi:hypothetical protein